MSQRFSLAIAIVACLCTLARGATPSPPATNASLLEDLAAAKAAVEPAKVGFGYGSHQANNLRDAVLDCRTIAAGMVHVHGPEVAPLLEANVDRSPAVVIFMLDALGKQDIAARALHDLCQNEDSWQIGYMIASFCSAPTRDRFMPLLIDDYVQGYQPSAANFCSAFGGPDVAKRLQAALEKFPPDDPRRTKVTDAVNAIQSRARLDERARTDVGHDRQLLWQIYASAVRTVNPEGGLVSSARAAVAHGERLSPEGLSKGLQENDYPSLSLYLVFAQAQKNPLIVPALTKLATDKEYGAAVRDCLREINTPDALASLKNLPADVLEADQRRLAQKALSASYKAFDELWVHHALVVVQVESKGPGGTVFLNIKSQHFGYYYSAKLGPLATPVLTPIPCAPDDWLLLVFDDHGVVGGTPDFPLTFMPDGMPAIKLKDDRDPLIDETTRQASILEHELQGSPARGSRPVAPPKNESRQTPSSQPK